MTVSSIARLAEVVQQNALAPCVAASQINLVLSGLQTLDGVLVQSGDRVLVRAQTNAAENGIYIAATNAWQRATDWNQTEDVVSGVFVGVWGGSKAGLYQSSFADPLQVGTSPVVFSQYTQIEVPVEGGELNVFIGQSNAESSNANAAGGDLTAVDGVFLWRGNAWTVWDLSATWNGYPGGPDRAGQNNALFHYARKRYNETGIKQYCVLDAQGGLAISNWVPATGPRYVSLQSQMTAAISSAEMVALGKTAADRFFFWQGEADSGNGNYGRNIDGLSTQLVAESWFNVGTPIIGVEISPNFAQTDYWRNAPANANPNVTAVGNSGVAFPDNTHADAAGLKLIGERFHEMVHGSSVAAQPIGARVIKPLPTNPNVTITVGPGARFETLREAVDWTNEQSLVGAKLVTLRLTPGEHACADMGYFHGSMPLVVRGWTDPGSIPAETAYGNDAASARAAIEAAWDTRLICQPGDVTGVTGGAKKIDFLYLGIIENGAGINVGMEIDGTASIRECAVHGFANDGIKINEQAECELQDVVVYGGATGIDARGRVYSGFTTGRKIMLLGQTTYALNLDNRSVTGVLPTVSVRNFTGNHAILAQRGANAHLMGLETDAIKGLIRTVQGTVTTENVSCPEVNAGGVNATFDAANNGFIHVKSGVTIPASDSRLMFAQQSSRISVNGDVALTAWNRVAGNVVDASGSGARIETGDLTIGPGTGQGANQIRSQHGGVIQTTGITLTAPLSVTNSNTPNAAQGGAVTWGNVTQL